MRDPWADVRERVDDKGWVLNGSDLPLMDPHTVILRLLTDATALLDVARAAKTYRDSHTMEGANKEGELLMDFTARIVDERAKLDEALDALQPHLRAAQEDV